MKSDFTLNLHTKETVKMQKRAFWSIFITSLCATIVLATAFIATELSHEGTDVNGLMLTITVTLLVLTAVLFVSALIISRWIGRPLRNLNFDNPLTNRTYSEVDPMLSSVEKKNGEIADRMEALTRQRSEFDHITSSMSEGIVVISSEGTVLSANRSARELLSIENGSHYSDLKDGNDVIRILNSALAGEKTVGNISRSGMTYRLTANPVTNPYGEYSVVLLILDVTSSEQAEALRREFSANVSHELKTPLTAILGYAEIISNGVAQPKDVPAFAEQIHSEAQRLLTLIEDIIKLSRLDEKNLRSEFEDVDIGELCESVVRQLSQKAKDNCVELSFNGASAVLSGIKPVLYEIIFNLADNAITYNRPGGSANIAIAGSSQRPVLIVSDTGIGIAKEDQSRIFERFYRVDKSHSKETGGTGLGLSIVKHGALLHSAEILLESELGKGTTVTVAF